MPAQCLAADTRGLVLHRGLRCTQHSHQDARSLCIVLLVAEGGFAAEGEWGVLLGDLEAHVDHSHIPVARVDVGEYTVPAAHVFGSTATTCTSH